MKWIAVRKEDGRSIHLVRVDTIDDLFMKDGSLSVTAKMDDLLFSVVPHPPEPLKSILAQLNGPVGEVPWK